MLKVMWFLKRADHLTLDDFHRWWMETHVPAVVEAQRPYLKKYVVNLRSPEDLLPGKPSNETDWDGVAEQWFETEDDFKAVHGRASVGATRADTLKHVSRLARMIVRENTIQVETGSGG